MGDTTDHDQLFKEVIREFFPDFLRLFFPDQAARFDLSRVNWLDKELFADPPDGSKHVLDLVAELTEVSGDSTLALIHVEIESAESVTDIERRLPNYYFYLRRAKRKAVLPVVVFLKVGLDGIGVREIRDPPEGDPTLIFFYRYVGLPALPAAEYLRGDNWLGVALSALMKAGNEQRVPFGIEAMKRLGESPLTDGKKSLLGDCIETYIDIPDADSDRFQDILEANATGKVPAMHKTRVQIAHEKGIERGREEGIERGIERGVEEGQLLALRAAITELFEARFGSVPPSFADWIRPIPEPASLRRILIAAGTAVSVEAFQTSTGWAG